MRHKLVWMLSMIAVLVFANPAMAAMPLMNNPVSWTESLSHQTHEWTSPWSPGTFTLSDDSKVGSYSIAYLIANQNSMYVRLGLTAPFSLADARIMVFWLKLDYKTDTTVTKNLDIWLGNPWTTVIASQTMNLPAGDLAWTKITIPLVNFGSPSAAISEIVFGIDPAGSPVTIYIDGLHFTTGDEIDSGGAVAPVLTKSDIEAMGFVTGPHTVDTVRSDAEIEGLAQGLIDADNVLDDDSYAGKGHKHEYLTGRGEGHNNTVAITSQPK